MNEVIAELIFARGNFTGNPTQIRSGPATWWWFVFRSGKITRNRSMDRHAASMTRKLVQTAL